MWISQTRTGKVQRKLGEFEMGVLLKLAFPFLGHINPVDQCSKDDKFENTLKSYLSFAYSDYDDEPSLHSEIYMT